MKKLIKNLTVFSCAALCALSFAGCSGKSTLLGKPAEFEKPEYTELRGEEFASAKQNAEKFANTFAPNAYGQLKVKNNFAVSPISVYMALALAAECSGGSTQEQILSALGATQPQLRANVSSLYRNLSDEFRRGAKLASMLKFTNSIWVSEGTEVNTSCIDALSNYYFSYSYSADFQNDNSSANKAVQNFVKKQTNGLIDTNFELAEDTLFTLINTLYLKTLWNDDGEDLPFAVETYNFANSDGTQKQTRLLQGKYLSGKAYESEKFTSFYSRTYDGYRIKFLIPKDGYTVDEVFTPENLAEANGAEYIIQDDEKREIYFTRCIFPEYSCAYDGDLCEILQNKYGINNLFDENNCDFSPLTHEKSYCDKIRHVTNLKVDKKGIEGAAVTVIRGAGAAGPPEYTMVYEDLVADKAFGFVITDYNDVTLFSGVVNKI